MMWRLFLLAGDTFLVVSLLALTLLLVAPLHLSLEIPGYGLKTWDAKLVWACLALVSWSVAVTITQAQESVCATNRFKGSLSVLLALVLMFIFWIGLTRLLTGEEMNSSLAVELLFLALAALTLSPWRLLLAEFTRLPRFRPQAIIVGVTSAGETIARELQGAKYPGANVLGYIRERIDERSQKNGFPILGSRNALRHLVQSGMIDMIIMALDYRASPEIFQEAIEAAQLGIAVVPMSVIYERIAGKIPVEHVGDQWYGALPSERIISPLYLCWRKVMDVTFGLFGIAVLLLILPVLALLIYLDSPGPIFYSQERMGYRGRAFHILKFRSMQADAEDSGRAIWAAEQDARVTRIGRFIRATHLDELPQALNILRGEMSLIGPRPERQEFVDQLETTIPFYRCRLSVKPGLTGWAQIKYSYASTVDDTLLKLQYDLYYIKHQSFTLDIFIVLKTVVEVLRGRGR
jgi:exopolysaccharide biosynthesis polyprenyl glycosylphosphotransferase